MISAVVVLEEARLRGLIAVDDTLNAERQALWDARVGDDPFWIDFEREMPGFLKAMLILSPDIFTGFFDYCAIPWKSGAVPARVKELIAMASDATPAHRSEEHTSELQSLMRLSYAVFCLKKKK